MDKGVNMANKRKISEEDLEKHIIDFFKAVSEDTDNIYLPTITDFCIYLQNEKNIKINRDTIHNYFNFSASIKKQFDKFRADALVRGGIKGKYQPTITIFALKNWCNWKDKQELDTADDKSIKIDIKKELKDYSK